MPEFFLLIEKVMGNSVTGVSAGKILPTVILAGKATAPLV